MSRPSSTLSWPVLLATVALVVPGFGPAAAQSLAEMTVVSAAASELHPSVRLPRGTVRAIGPGLERWVARVRDAASWTDWEGYAAQGLAVRLRPAFVHQVTTSFAAAGFFEAERETRSAGSETHTRIEFENPGGERTLLFLIDGPDELSWLIASSR